MFDFPYLALSLEAVLQALAVGIVIVVAIGDSNLVSSAKSGIVHDLESEVSAAQRQNSQARAQLTSEEAFTNALYPIAVHALLRARPVGLVFLGNGSDQIDGLVREAVSAAGGDLVTVAALREPVDLAGLARDAAGTRFAALQEMPANGGAQLQLLERFGALAGAQLVSGGQAVAHELLSRARGQLLSAFDGQLGKLEGLVVARTEPAGMTPEAAQDAAALEAGLVRGASGSGAATVGVEVSATNPSQVPWYQGHGMSSVDDLDVTAGRAALAYALAGARGSYGTKGTANSLLPAVTSLGEGL